MSLPRPTGMKTPSRLARPSGLPAPRSAIPAPGGGSRAQSALAKSARAAGLSAPLAEKYAAETIQYLPGPEVVAPPPPPPADDFIVGDRVFVSGTKPGFIAFLGETQFAPGEWAGVVLDEMAGKNDGSVNGVRYFQCEPKRGVFCRISKLSRTPGVVGVLKSEDALSEASAPLPPNGANTTDSATARRPTTPSMQHRPTTPSQLRRPTTPSLPRTSASKSLSGSNTSLNKGTHPTPAPTASSSAGAQNKQPPPGKQNLKLGDRVLVSGSKPGTLRYIGVTDFAKGQWAGVELDDALGKNDGAVAGKRYFECQPRYGLFAPVHKVTRIGGSTTPSPMSRSLGSANLRLSRERSGSQESVSSLSSSASMGSRPRNKTSQRPSTLNLSTTSALQKALKEKEEHIEQLLRERDLERAEVARSAAQVDEAEGKLSLMKQDQERFQEDHEEIISHLRLHVQELEKDNKELKEKLEDEKRKIEDLQFQIEEEVISKDDLESRTEEEEYRIREMEKTIKKEKDRADKFENEVHTLRAQVERYSKESKSAEETQTAYLDQIEELTHKLSQAESKIRSYESSRLEEGAKTSQVGLELAEKSARVTELEDILSAKSREIKQHTSRVSELEDDLKTSRQKQDKLQKSLDELSGRLNSNEADSNKLNSEVQNLKSLNADLQRQLEGSKQRADELTEEKNSLENQIGEMMKNSGNSSKQLSVLNDQLGQKNRKIEDLQADLSSSTQKWARLNDELEQTKLDSEKEKNILIAKHDKMTNTIRNQFEDVQKELEKSKTKMKTMSEDFDKDKNMLLQRKDCEISELKKQLEASAEEVNKQEIQTQAHKQVLDKITMEKEAVQFEKEKIEKHLKRLESEKESLNSELIQAKVELSKVQSSMEQTSQERASTQEQIQDLKDEKDRINKVKSELQKQKDEVSNERDKMMEERDQVQREVVEGRATLQQKDMQLEELQKEVERLRSETAAQQETLNQQEERINQQDETLSQLSQQETLTGTLQSQLNQAHKEVTELRTSLHDVEMERDSIKAQLGFSQLVSEEKKRLEEQVDQLNQQIEEIQESHREEVELVESEKTLLQEEVDNTAALLQQKETDLRSKENQVINLENDNSKLMSFKSTSQRLESEKIELMDKINQLESKLSESKANANVISNIGSTDNAVLNRLKEEKEASENQVTFLNSVIVDLQRKNDELKTRLEAMESGIVNGEADHSMEIVSPSRRAPPRLFCDICDVFDTHDTEDCPLQEMSDSPPPTQYHGDRHQVRPYCTICEEFHTPCPVILEEPESEEADDTKQKTEDNALTDENIKSEEMTSQMTSSLTSQLTSSLVGEQFSGQIDLFNILYRHELEGNVRDSGYYDGSPPEVGGKKEFSEIGSEFEKAHNEGSYYMNPETWLYSGLVEKGKESNESGKSGVKILVQDFQNMFGSLGLDSDVMDHQDEASMDENKTEIDIPEKEISIDGREENGMGKHEEEIGIGEQEGIDEHEKNERCEHEEGTGINVGNCGKEIDLNEHEEQTEIGEHEIGIDENEETEIGEQKETGIDEHKETGIDGHEEETNLDEKESGEDQSGDEDREKEETGSGEMLGLTNEATRGNLEELDQEKNPNASGLDVHKSMEEDSIGVTCEAVSTDKEEHIEQNIKEKDASGLDDVDRGLNRNEPDGLAGFKHEMTAFDQEETHMEKAGGEELYLEKEDEVVEPENAGDRLAIIEQSQKIESPYANENTGREAVNLDVDSSHKEELVKCTQDILQMEVSDRDKSSKSEVLPDHQGTELQDESCIGGGASTMVTEKKDKEPGDKSETGGQVNKDNGKTENETSRNEDIASFTSVDNGNEDKGEQDGSAEKSESSTLSCDQAEANRGSGSSESEYQSGHESFSSDVDGMAEMDQEKTDIETSVDTGEVFKPDDEEVDKENKIARGLGNGEGDEKPDVDTKTANEEKAENCCLS